MEGIVNCICGWKLPEVDNKAVLIKCPQCQVRWWSPAGSSYLIPKEIAMLDKIYFVLFEEKEPSPLKMVNKIRARVDELETFFKQLADAHFPKR